MLPRVQQNARARPWGMLSTIAVRNTGPGPARCRLADRSQQRLGTLHPIHGMKSRFYHVLGSCLWQVRKVCPKCLAREIRIYAALNRFATPPAPNAWQTKQLGTVMTRDRMPPDGISALGSPGRHS